MVSPLQAGGSTRDELDIRRIRPDEAPALQRFYNDLSHETRRLFRPLGWHAALEQCRQWVAENAADPDTRYDLVVVDGEQIVGWCFIMRLDTDRPTYGIGVADAYHRLGLGRELTRDVLDEARRRGCREVELTCVQDNKVAHNMYAKFGFQRTGEFTGGDGLPYYRMVVSLNDLAR